MTQAQWEAKAVWHLEQAELAIDALGPDAVSFGAKVTAHARLASAICAAIDTKVIK